MLAPNVAIPKSTARVNQELTPYHAPKSVGGHVRIYSSTELKAKLRTAGLDVIGSHRAHALHSPYWWLKCAVGPRNDDHPLVTRYRRLLEWEITDQPRSMQVAMHRFWSGCRSPRITPSPSSFPRRSTSKV